MHRAVLHWRPVTGSDHPELVFFPRPPVHTFTWSTLALGGIGWAAWALWTPLTANGGAHPGYWVLAALVFAAGGYAVWRFCVHRAYSVARLTVWKQRRLLSVWPLTSRAIVALRDAEFRARSYERVSSQLASEDLFEPHREEYYLQVMLHYNGKRELFANHILDESRYDALEQLQRFAQAQPTGEGP